MICSAATEEPHTPCACACARRLLLGDASECMSGGGGGALLSGGADVPAELLADCDSHFLDVDGLVVHYKEASPAAASRWTGHDTALGRTQCS
jgi:hypothetical protein